MRLTLTTIIIFFLIFSATLSSCVEEQKRGLQEDYAQVIDTSYYNYSVDTSSTIEYSSKKLTTYLNIHCTASKEGLNLGKQWFLKFFEESRGWSKPGYNFLVLLDGTIETLVPINYDQYTTWDEVSYGIRGKNSISINVAYVGGVDKNLKPKDTRTLAQRRSLDNIVNNITCKIPGLKVMGHNEHNGVVKACPSFSVRKEYGYLNPPEYFTEIDTTDIDTTDIHTR